MATARLIISIDVDIPEVSSSKSSLEVVNSQRNRMHRAVIKKGLKRTVGISNCLINSERLIDTRIFNSSIDFDGLSISIEYNVSGRWERSNVNFTKSFEGDGFEIV